jgi:cytochrome c553
MKANKRRRLGGVASGREIQDGEPQQPPRSKLRIPLRLFAFISFVSYFLLLFSQAYFSSPVADGAALFTANCAKCHGQDGRGIPKYLKKGQKDFTDVKWQRSRTDAQLIKAIADGKGEFMPPWKDKFSTEEMKSLVGKIRDFGKEK